MTYSSALETVMPTVMDMPCWLALELAIKLIAPVDGYPAGSSFAITAEPYDGERRVYLSSSSDQRLSHGGDLAEWWAIKANNASVRCRDE